MLPLEITPQEVKQMLEAGQRVRLIDVREPPEFQICRLDAAELIPMRSIPQALPLLHESAGEATLVFFCHHGIRSLQVVSWLRQRGLPDCRSMQGGIEQWSVAIDPSVPRY